VEGVGRFRLYGTTIDDAVGEAFDKVAKLLHLPYPGGPRIEALAATGKPKAYALPRPLRGRAGADFSFSGLKTAVRLIADAGAVDMADLAASFQAAVVDILIDRTAAAMTRFRGDFPDAEAPALVLAGGVAANGAIRSALTGLAQARGFQTKIPPPRLCTDNAAMVAWAGVEHGQLGLFDDIGVSPKARWPLAGTPLGGRDWRAGEA
jgi:N6-L-threonylcarbamoyladenine synthase